MASPERQENYRTYTEAGWRPKSEVFVDSTYAIAHKKIMVTAEEVVITGSFSFTS